jgi:hypothetical protein
MAFFLGSLVQILWGCETFETGERRFWGTLGKDGNIGGSRC